MSPSRLPPAFINVIRRSVDHFTLTFALIVCKVAGVGVPGSVSHGAVAGALIGGPVADVGVAVHVDDCAGAVDEAV